MQDQIDHSDPIKADFRNFLFLLWQHLSLPHPTEIQYDIAHFLQHGPRRMIIEAFRGVGKSWITAALVLWLLYCNPEERILVVSASKDRADAFSIFVRRIIEEWDFLQHLKPREGQRDSALAFDVGPSSVHQAPSVRSVGINGQLTGGRATVIIADDIEVPKNSLTQMMRDRLSEAVKEFDAVLTPGGRVIYLGTPQTELSLYNTLPSRGYVMRVWPARYPQAVAADRMRDRLAPLILAAMDKDPTLSTQCGGRGAPTDPQRFSDLDLMDRAGSYGRSGFALQFMLDTSVSDQDRYPLKLSDMMCMDIDLRKAPVSLAWGTGRDQTVNDVPVVGLAGDRWYSPMFISKDWTEYQGVVMAIDPAGRGGDELAYAIVAMLNGWLFVLDCGGLVGGYKDENLQELANLAKTYGVKHVLVEENFGDGMFTKLLTPFLVKTYPVTTEEVKHSIQKEKRIIDTLEPVLNQHRLVVDRKLIQRDAENRNGYPEDHAHAYQLFYQLTRVTKERGALRKDDRLDVLAMAVAYWGEQMDADTDKAEREHKKKMLEQELRKFHQHVFGRPAKKPRWFSL